MKVAKWKVLSLAGALVLGYAVNSQAGVQLKVNDNTYANFGYWMLVKFDSQSKLADGGKTTYAFTVPDARIVLDGKINKLTEFFADVNMAVTASGSQSAKLEEGGLNLSYTPIFQIRLGVVRVPFTRDQLVPVYTGITANEAFWDPQVTNFVIKPGFTGIKSSLLNTTNAGAVFHGELQDGMIRYAFGLFNEGVRSNAYTGFGVAGRVEFTPTMVGFKPAPKNEANGWEQETYFGKAGDILTVGLGFYRTTTADKNQLGPDELHPFGITTDVFFEKKLPGTPVVLDLAGTYTHISDDTYYTDASGNWQKGSSNYYSILAQGLLDQTVGIGKPALYLRYDGAKVDYHFTKGDDAGYSRFTLGCNYYLNGEAEKVNFGIDYAKYSDGLKDTLKANNYKDSVTDFFVQFQMMF
ncbi:MAG: hypothetical protein GXO57_01655 [Thermodesulfobacteria bacterium]|nr:hypothetical protein [Thermodesulfobacteriota bacterium]